jgi:hypothetical protein
LSAKLAVTLWSELTVNMQVPVPEHPPDQPENTDPEAGVAVSVTWLPAVNGALHVRPQLIPAGELVTVPAPAPALVTVTACVAGGGAEPKVAVTVWSEVSVRVQVPVPEHPPPDQPENTNPAAGVAVSVTCVPEANGALHVLPQSIPAGKLVTLPEPVPAFATVSVRWGTNTHAAPAVPSKYPPMSAVLASWESAALLPKLPGPVSSLAVSLDPCWVQVELERVNIHAAPTLLLSLAPAIKAVLPSEDSDKLPPNKPAPVSSLAVSLDPCWVQVEPERVNTHAAPT